MKTLVISLLRAGDILMQKPLFDALKKLTSQRDLHLLLNDEVAWIAPLVSGMAKVHIFPRKTLQRLMGEGCHNLARAPKELNDFIQTLKNEKFDEVFNFTHNRLSAYLAEEIQAPLNIGLISEGQRFKGINNTWLKLFNDRFSTQIRFGFHYSEILSLAMGLETKKFVSADKPRTINRIFLQTFTSDSKKNWQILNFRLLLDKLYQTYPHMVCRVLATQKDKEVLAKYFEDEEICTWDLQKMASEMTENDLLITGDTVVMHLASQKNVQVLELALGASDPWRTGPYGEGHIVLQSKVDCYPCVHSRPCRQLSHLCGDSIAADFVGRVVSSVIDNKDLPASSNQVDVFKTHIDENIGWWIEHIGEGKGGYQVMNKILWQLLERQDVSFGKSVAAYFLKIGMPSLNKSQAELKEKLFELQAGFEVLIKKLGEGQLTIAEVQYMRRDLSQIKPSAEISEWLWTFQDLANMPFATPLHFLSAFQDRLEQLKAVVYHREQLIEKLKTGDRYESGSGKVSDSSFAET